MVSKVAAVSLLLLTGCQSVPVGTKLPDEPTSLLVDCGQASQLPEKFDLRNVLLGHADDRQTIDQCRTRHKALSDWVRNLYHK